MSKYRKKPVVIEAIEYDGSVASVRAIAEWADLPEGIQLDGSLTIPTMEGDYKATIGDFIIQGVAGEFYPCKPDIFASTYEEVLEEATDVDR